MSQSPSNERSWSKWHMRLHKRLKQNKSLLPSNSTLLLAISGGQDSMALLKLITDLKRLYQWQVEVWLPLGAKPFWKPSSQEEELSSNRVDGATRIRWHATLAETAMRSRLPNCLDVCLRRGQQPCDQGLVSLV